MTEPLVVLPGFMADARGFLPQIVHLGADRPMLLRLPTGGETVEQMTWIPYQLVTPENYKDFMK